jgi:uncharacterized protein (TIGR00369 family)
MLINGLPAGINFHFRETLPLFRQAESASLAEARSASFAEAQSMTRKITRTLAPEEATVALTPERDICFGCGSANSAGLQLVFTLGDDSKSYVCEFSLDGRFVGPPGHAHGGIIATILDEAMSKANKLKANTLKTSVALTRHFEIEYLRPVPLGQPLFARGRVSRMMGRVIYNRAELCNAAGVVLARGRGKFLAVDAERMFARELERERAGAI